MTVADTLGTIASMFSVIALSGLVTQIVKIRKRKSSDDFSLFSVYVNALNLLSWLLYGLAVWKFYLIVPQSVAFILLVTLIVHIHAYRK